MNMREIMTIAEAARVYNTGDLGRLEAALNEWVEGNMAKAQPHLLALAPIATGFAAVDVTELYRGFLPQPSQWKEYRRSKQITIETNPAAPLASWSTSPEAVTKFMFGFEDPWVMIRHPVADLKVYINLAEFDREAHPFTKMHSQDEVIVYMPPRLVVRPVSVHDWRKQ